MGDTIRLKGFFDSSFMGGSAWMSSMASSSERLSAIWNSTRGRTSGKKKLHILSKQVISALKNANFLAVKISQL